MDPGRLVQVRGLFHPQGDTLALSPDRDEPITSRLKLDHSSNIADSIWLLFKRSMINFDTADLDGLVRIIERKLKGIQSQPYMIDGCPAGVDLIIEPW